MKKFAVFCLASVFSVWTAVSIFSEQTTVSEAVDSAPSDAWKYISAALAVGFACIGGGIAVGRLGAAAMGAIAEDPSLSGKALPYVGLAEGICLWGFLVALLILMV
jgi:V/A-type H+-transporting ATPase subunit K